MAQLPEIHPARCIKYPYTGRSFELRNTDLSNANMDMLTNRPRTPNDQYTELTDQQLSNLKKEAKPFFMKQTSGTKPIVRPAPIERTAVNTSQFLYRGTPKNHPQCWIDEPYRRDPPMDHDTCRAGASLRWGPQKTGERTIGHFSKEDVHRYLNIDVYKRNPTNIPSMVVMKHGRPSEGYFQQRNPNFNTWFGSTHQLNETNVLTTIRPKTFADYAYIKNQEQAYAQSRCGKWPETSEYTQKYLLNTKEPCALKDMDDKKQYHRAQRRAAAEAALQAA